MKAINNGERLENISLYGNIIQEFRRIIRRSWLQHRNLLQSPMFLIFLASVVCVKISINPLKYFRGSFRPKIKVSDSMHVIDYLVFKIDPKTLESLRLCRYREETWPLLRKKIVRSPKDLRESLRGFVR